MLLAAPALCISTALLYCAVSLCLGVSAAPLASAYSGPASFVIRSVGSTVSISSVARRNVAIVHILRMLASKLTVFYCACVRSNRQTRTIIII